MMAGELRTERDGPVGVLVISHPGKRNALTHAMFDAFPGSLRSLADDPAVRAIVVRGDGVEAFSGGADIDELPAARATPEAALAHSRSVDAAIRALADVRKPTVAQLHGACFGGAAGLAAACGVRLADERFRFAVPAARLGVVYEAEAARALAEAVGPSAAYELLVSGRVVDAAEALRLGLVSAVLPVDELDAHVRAYARRLAAAAPLALEGAWLAVRAVREPGSGWLDELEALKRRSYAGPDAAEGLAAAREGRDPVFRGA